MFNRRTLLTTAALSAVPLSLPPMALAQGRKDSMVIGMTLEPPGLDPTANAASAIAEVVQYNILETLTKINSDGSVTPLLAESWDISPDLHTYTFKLRHGVKFQNGEPLNARTVKFSFERASSDKSTNKDKHIFANMSVQAVDEHTVVLMNKEIDPNLPFLLGQSTAVIVEPRSADANAVNPVGTGPYKFDRWSRGSSLTVAKWDGFRDAGAVKLARATFRFISDPAAQAAALLAGDVDALPRGVATRIVPQFKADPRFQVILCGSLAKTIVSINNRHKPLDDVRVRRAISAAIDRKAVIEGAVDGFGVPIGSHYVPSAAGYVDTTGINPFDPDKAKQLLAEAGVKLPLELTMPLPPPSYARQGGEVVAAELAKVGIDVKVQNVEWAQWISGVLTNKEYDLTIVSHVEPFDLGRYADPNYYWGYQSKEYDALYDEIMKTASIAERNKLLGDAQRLLARDAVNVFLFQPLWPTVARKNVRGLWQDAPIFVNDLAALSWA